MNKLMNIHIILHHSTDQYSKDIIECRVSRIEKLKDFLLLFSIFMGLLTVKFKL